MNKVFFWNRLIAEALPILALDVLFFLFVEKYTSARLVALICLHFGYAFMIISGRQTKSKDSGVVFGYPRIAVAFTTFLLTVLVLAGVFMFDAENAKWTVVIEVVFLACGISSYCVLNCSESASRISESEFKQNCAFVRYASQMLLEAKANITDVQCRKSLTAAYDAVRNGNVASVPAANELERSITGLVDEIVELSADAANGHRIGELSKEIVSSMRKRETLIKINR